MACGVRISFEPIEHWKGSSVPPDRNSEPGQSVLSSDPALGTWAPVVSRVLDAQGRLLEVVFNKRVDDASRQAANALYDSALMLRINHLYRLGAIDTAPIPPERFALPGPILTREQLRALAAAHPGQ